MLLGKVLLVKLQKFTNKTFSNSPKVNTLPQKTNFYAKIIILSPCLLIQLFDLPMLRRPRSLKIDKLQGCLSIGKSNICINKHGLKINIFSWKFVFLPLLLDFGRFGKVLLVNLCSFTIKTFPRSIFWENGENFIYKTICIL